MPKVLQKKKISPTSTGRQIASRIYVFFKINDVQGRAICMNDLLHIEVVRDNTQKVRTSLERHLDGTGLLRMKKSSKPTAKTRGKTKQ